jgi:PAS domain S-box-containing protein
MSTNTLIEKKLWQSNDAINQFINSISIGIIIQNAQAEITGYNKTALALLGLTDDIIGKTNFDPKWDVLHPDGKLFEGHKQPAVQAITTRQSIREVVMGIFRHKFNDRVWMMVNADPVLDEDGEVVEVISSFTDVSVQKSQIETIRLLSLITRETNNGVTITDSKGNVVWMNEAFSKLSGYTKTEVLNQTPADLFFARKCTSTSDATIRNFQNSLTAFKPIETEVCLLQSKTGRQIWIKLQGKTFSSSADAGELYFTIYRNITDSKTAELALKKREMTFAAIGEATRSFILIDDFSKAIQTALAITGKALGLSRIYVFEKENNRTKNGVYFEWVQKGIGSVYHRKLENRKHLESLPKLIYRQDKSEPIFISVKKLGASNLKKMLDANGTLSILLIPIYSGSELWGYIGCDDCAIERQWEEWEQDILTTFSTTMENAIAKRKVAVHLKESNDRFLAVSNATKDAVWDCNLQTEEVFWNDRMYAVFGYARKMKPHTKTWEQNLHPDDKKRVLAKLKKSIQKKDTNWQDEYRYRCGDGSYKTVEDKGFLMYDENGKFYRFVGSLEDLTERKQMEAQMLQQKVHEQNAIANAYINAQDKERLEIGKELHDNINQILSTTQLYLDVALHNNDMRMELIGKSLENVHFAINEIRNLSRSLVPPSLGDIGLKASIKDLVDSINLVQKIKISLRYSIKNEARLEDAVQLMVFRIIQEQVNNIIKHAKADNASITMSLVKKQLVLQIADNGVGFDMQRTKKGIGLTNIANRVKLLNGEMNLKTQKGSGCVLEVTIPI